MLLQHYRNIVEAECWGECFDGLTVRIAVAHVEPSKIEDAAIAVVIPGWLSVSISTVGALCAAAVQTHS